MGDRYYWTLQSTLMQRIAILKNKIEKNVKKDCQKNIKINSIPNTTYDQISWNNDKNNRIQNIIAIFKTMITIHFYHPPVDVFVPQDTHSTQSPLFVNLNVTNLSKIKNNTSYQRQPSSGSLRSGGVKLFRSSCDKRRRRRRRKTKVK